MAMTLGTLLASKGTRLQRRRDGSGGSPARRATGSSIFWPSSTSPPLRLFPRTSALGAQVDGDPRFCGRGASTKLSHPLRIFGWVPPAPAPGQILEGLTPAQRAAVESEAAPLCILAAAGAGKTRVLTRRMAYRVATGSASAKHSLALTFTRKAAGELQHRLRDLGLREEVTAGTFHSVASGQLQMWWSDRRQPAPSLLDRKARLLAPLASSRPGLA